MKKGLPPVSRAQAAPTSARSPGRRRRRGRRSPLRCRGFRGGGGRSRVPGARRRGHRSGDGRGRDRRPGRCRPPAGAPRPHRRTRCRSMATVAGRPNGGRRGAERRGPAGAGDEEPGHPVENAVAFFLGRNRRPTRPSERQTAQRRARAGRRRRRRRRGRRAVRRHLAQGRLGLEHFDERPVRRGQSPSWQRPHSTEQPWRSTRVAKSSSRRVLPIPCSPARIASPPWPAAACSTRSRSGQPRAHGRSGRPAARTALRRHRSATSQAPSGPRCAPVDRGEGHKGKPGTAGEEPGHDPRADGPVRRRRGRTTDGPRRSAASHRRRGTVRHGERSRRVKAGRAAMVRPPMEPNGCRDGVSDGIEDDAHPRWARISPVLTGRFGQIVGPVGVIVGYQQRHEPLGVGRPVTARREPSASSSGSVLPTGAGAPAGCPRSPSG